MGVVGAGLVLVGAEAADDEAGVFDGFGKAVDEGALFAQGCEDGVELAFEMEAAVDDHVGGVHGADVGLGGLVEVGVDAGAHEGRDLDVGDAVGEDSGEVAGLGGGGDDAEGAVGADARGGGGVRLGLLFGGCGRFGGGFGDGGVRGHGRRLWRAGRRAGSGGRWVSVWRVIWMVVFVCIVLVGSAYRGSRSR